VTASWSKRLCGFSPQLLSQQARLKSDGPTQVTGLGFTY